MIVITLLNAHVIAINPDLITRIDVTPDTTISLLNGDKIIAKETLDEVMGKILEFRRAIHGGAGDAYPPSHSVGAAWGRDDDENESPAPLRPITRLPRGHG